MGITTIRNCAASRNGPIASMPIGFAAPGTGDSCIGAGSSRIAKKTTASATPSTHANHLQRGEGRCPSGNSSSKNVTGSTTIGIQLG